MTGESIELRKARRRIVEAAQDVLDGRLSVLEGARKLAALRADVDPAGKDRDLNGFAGIDSQSDHLPIGSSRKYWDVEALRLKDVDATDHEALFRDSALRMCRNLVARYGPPS